MKEFFRVNLAHSFERSLTIQWEIIVWPICEYRRIYLLSFFPDLGRSRIRKRKNGFYIALGKCGDSVIDTFPPFSSVLHFATFKKRSTEHAMRLDTIVGRTSVIVDTSEEREILFIFFNSRAKTRGDIDSHRNENFVIFFNFFFSRNSSVRRITTVHSTQAQQTLNRSAAGFVSLIQTICSL